MIMLRALLFANGFGLLIGLLIIFMDKVINNYGEVAITINHDKEIRGDGGKTLLRILFESKYFIPSACGGKGTCGYCKLKVVEGGGTALPTEALMLTRSEIREQYRLACQLKVKENLQVEIPPEYLEIQEYEGMFSLSEQITEDIKRVRMQLITPETISYKPGQYVQVRIPTDDGFDFRAYSMSSNPDEQNEIELNIKLIPAGIGSSYLHAKQVGDPVEFSGPYGDFYLKTHSDREIICVAGGVGLAPLKSIVAYWVSHNLSRPIYLFYGARSLKDLYDHDYFTGIAEIKPQFHYFPALSDPAPDWDGTTGFIHTVLDRELITGIHGEAYLCGPPIMIDAVMAVLESKGIPKESILYDKF